MVWTPSLDNLIYEISVFSVTIRSINPTTLLIRITPIPTAHSSREGRSKLILIVIRVVKIMPVLLLLKKLDDLIVF